MLNSLSSTLLSFFGGLLGADSTGENVKIPIDPAVREAVLMAFIILMAIAAVAIVVVILLQKGTNDNVGVISGTSDTFYGKNKERNKESILKRVTLILFAFIIVCAIICFVIGSVGWE